MRYFTKYLNWINLGVDLIAIGQYAIFGEDLIWRLINFVKVGGDLIGRRQIYPRQN